MKAFRLLMVLALGVSVLAGCVTKPNRPDYVWQDYSSSLYALKKTPNDESIAKHKEVLSAIIEESKNKNYRVPPGVFCEYGYLLLKEGKNDEALRYFDLEEQAYPEAKIFMQNLKRQVTRTSGGSESSNVELDKKTEDKDGEPLK